MDGKLVRIARKVRTILAAFVLVVGSESAFPQSYGNAPFVPGLPEFPPIQRWITSESESATIPLADTLGTIYVCRGLDSHGTPVTAFLHRRFDKSWTMSLGFPAGQDSVKETQFDVMPFGNRNVRYPIAIIVGRPLLRYRWLLSPASTVHGGIPTPAQQEIQLGRPLPPLRAARLDSGVVDFALCRGRITVINYWATTCTPCILEMPGFNRLVERYGMRVRFVAVADDLRRDVAKFLKTRKFQFEQTLSNPDVKRVFGESYPRTVIVDASCNVAYDNTGGSPDTYRVIERTIQSLLRRR